MKGVILSTSFFILIFVTFLSLGWYVNFDHNRSLINNNFKKSLTQVGYKILNQEQLDEEVLMDYFIEEISPSLPNNFLYDFELLGYNLEPILIRMKIKAYSKNHFYRFVLEETLLEKELVDEE